MARSTGFYITGPSGLPEGDYDTFEDAMRAAESLAYAKVFRKSDGALLAVKAKTVSDFRRAVAEKKVKLDIRQQPHIEMNPAAAEPAIACRVCGEHVAFGPSAGATLDRLRDFAVAHAACGAVYRRRA